MTPPVPEPLRELVAHWRSAGSPTQPAMAWPRDRWIEDFPDHAAVLRGLPDALDRQAVRAACADAANNATSAEAAFVAVMAWGFGNVGYGRYRTRSILNDPRGANERLLAVARTLAESGPLPAYDRFSRGADCRLPGLGPAFGTKYLFFCQAPGQNVTALIFDALMSKGLRRLAERDLDPVPWSVRTYTEYLDLMHGWASSLGCLPDELEFCIFQAIATAQGNQWAAPWPTATEATPRQISGKAGVKERLLELGQLRDEGLITDDEYAEKRAAILDAL